MRGLVLGAAALAVWASLAVPAGADGLRAEAQALLDGFQAKHGFPGATAAWVLPDGTVQGVATGLADIEAGVPVTQDTRMLAASIGKSFVAATALALEAEGRLDRSDRVAAYLGDRA